MAGYVKDLPQNSATGASETVPWATAGTTLAPSGSEQSTGWRPQAVAGPPDYRLENFARKTQAALNFRANQAALFLEYANAEITWGTPDVATTRHVTIAGNTVSRADLVGDTVATICDAFVLLINSNPLMTGDATAIHDNPGDPLTILGVNPGVNIVVTSGVAGGTGTVSQVGPTDCVMRGADSAWYNADLVIGSPQINGDGDPNHHARFLFDKVNGAFRAGRATGTEWDNGNRGAESVAMGVDCKASGANSCAIGNGAQALSADSFALQQGTVTAGSALAFAAGSSFAEGAGAIAMGTASTAADVDGIAVGDNNSALNIADIAIGKNCSSAGLDQCAVTLGQDLSANDHGAFAAGSNGAAAGKGAVCIGYGGPAGFQQLQALSKGAIAMGYCESSVLSIVASGDHSFAQGDGSSATHKFSRATGNAAIAEANGERAHAPLQYNNERGHHQQGDVTLVARGCGAGRVLTTDTLDGTGSRWTIPLNSCYAVQLQCVGTKIGAGGSYVSFIGSGLIHNEGGTVTVQGILTGGIAQQYATNAAGWTLTGSVSGSDYVLTANSNGATGDAWTCTLRYTKAK